MSKSQKILMIIDMLNDFVLPGAPLEVPGAREIVPHIKAQIEKAHSENFPVLYLCDKHQKNDPEFRVWPPHAVKDTPGAEIVSELKPAKNDTVIHKITYSAFYQTKLDDFLKTMQPNELILTGVCTEICVLYTAVDALSRGYDIAVPPDCVAGLTKEGHEFALKQMTNVLKPYQRK